MKSSALLFLFFINFVPAAFAGMCPLCRQTLAMGGSEGLIQGFYWSILLIAGMPVLIFAFVFFYGHRMSKKFKSKNEKLSQLR